MQDKNGGLILWHGAQRWSGPPRVMPHTQGQYECGPGINMTTAWGTARKHSRGGGQLLEMTLTPKLVTPEVWLENASMPVQDMKQFVASISRLKNRAHIISDIESCAERMNSDTLRANILVNLFVNHEAGAGQPGVELANFLAANGIMASLHRPMGAEDWVIVFDPQAIINVHHVAAKELNNRPASALDFPPVQDQLEALRRSKALSTRAAEVSGTAPTVAPRPSARL